MKRLLHFWCFFFLLSSAATHADTSLWKVSHAGSYLYLAGTVHVISKTDLPFPSAFDAAYTDAQEVVLETDLAELFSPATQLKLMQQLSYQDGRTLQQFISPSLYAELNELIQKRGMPPNMLLMMKPSGVMMTLLALELQRLGIGQSGPDSVFFQRAVADSKPVSGLESVDEHIRFVANMGEGNEERFLRQTIIDIEQTEVMMRDIVQKWKQGDSVGLERAVLDDMREQYPRVYASLIVERNENWLPQITAMLNDSDTEMVLVGAAHLIGQDGLIRALKQAGYIVEQM